MSVFWTSSQLQVTEIVKANINQGVSIPIEPNSSFHNSNCYKYNYSINLCNLHEVNTAKI
jgi:hypothetical protein